MSSSRLVIGTRASALALRQAHIIRDVLTEQGHEVALREITTTGDRILDVPLSAIGDKALFTKELDRALLDGEIQLAVHSLKDLPTALPEGLVIAAVTRREDARDAFVSRADATGRLADVPEGGVLATSSLRRRAQLLAWRPDLRIEPVRGNVDTRLRKLGESTWAGLVLAAAGLTRLGQAKRITEIIGMDVMLPAVGQGALAIVCAAADEATRSVLHSSVHDERTSIAVIAERSMLRTLEGGCSVPVGSYGRIHNGQLELDGCVADLEGRRLVRGRRTGPVERAVEMGVDLARELIDGGAGEILDEIRERTER